MRVLVQQPVAALWPEPKRSSPLADEMLHGMEAEVLADEAEYVNVRAFYGYTGYAGRECLRSDPQILARWDGLPKMTVGSATADVLSQPKVQGMLLCALPRGSRVAALPGPENGWQPVLCADGRKGYMRKVFLSELPASPYPLESITANGAEVLRRRLVDTALSYLGAPYRWGGRTPQGLDCSGLCHMAYLLNGIIIFRDARIHPDYPVREIPLRRVKPGDLLYFPGHMAMALGEGRFVHASMGQEVVATASLREGDQNYRGDLAGQLLAAGSVFDDG